MKRITLPDFQWLAAQPHTTKRTRLSLKAMLASNTPAPPAGALLLAVSDEYFVCEGQVIVTGEAEVGLVFHHTDTTFVSIGMDRTSLFTTLSIMGWKNRIALPYASTNGERIWMMRRAEEGLFIGWKENEKQDAHWMGPFQLPGLKHSVSFGWYMTNLSEAASEVRIERFTYHRHP